MKSDIHQFFHTQDLNNSRVVGYWYNFGFMTPLSWGVHLYFYLQYSYWKEMINRKIQFTISKNNLTMIMFS